MSADQKILNGKGWANNPETKNAKNKLVRTYFRTDQGKNLLENPLIINSGKNAGRKKRSKSFQYETMTKLTQGLCFMQG